MNAWLLRLTTSFFLVSGSTAVSGQEFVLGLGRAKDGDSLMVGQTEVRLFGVDAPEFDQRCRRGGRDWACGSAAADKLMELVTGREVQCISMGTDQHQRVLGRCTVNGIEVNRTLVSLGMAVAYRRYSSYYVSDEARAKAAGLGIWSSSFEQPERYRHDGGLPKVKDSGAGPRGGSAVTQSSGGCIIKGNRNRKGQWIYHLPGMPYYEETRAEEMFCTEAQAQTAGYRRAIVK